MPARALSDFAPYSYRVDPSVADFPDTRKLIVFDGVCVLCSGFARFVAKHDEAEQFSFVTAQAPLGQVLFRHYGLDDTDFETNLLIEDGRAYGRMEAFARIMKNLGVPWSLAMGVLMFPRPVRNWLYDRIARNRYRIFGRYETCAAPDDPLLRTRLIG
jgi:predicted DCC family thiol-disulfide oxidoreductase YuxK